MKADWGQYAAAITDYDAAIRLAPDKARAYRFRGESKLEAGGFLAGNKDLIKANELANPRGFKKIESVIKSAIDP